MLKDVRRWGILTIISLQSRNKKGTKGIDYYFVTNYNLFPTQTYLRYVRVFKNFT